MRSMKEVEQDHANMLVRAGQLQYQIKVYKDDLNVLNEQLKDLNLEAAAILKANAEAKPAEVPVSSSEGSSS